MIETYEALIFENEPNWNFVNERRLSYWHWDSEAQYDTKFKMCLVKGKGFFVRMKTDEKDVTAKYVNRDDPVYKDSCMEFFLKPFSDKEEYLNFEVNPLGTYLCEYGIQGKRRYIKELTVLSPKISSAITADGWEIDIFVPFELVEKLFEKSFNEAALELRANFYKCGDESQKKHYGAFSEMTALPPGFHNPERFAFIKVRERKEK